ncbi:hypothetical protein Tdes44962_MAKER01839 [Teratosphaeria destructans]|uniref:Uncharacterized protein n=1 Tax=Teratosphaeria destructans TaxID=418781 RepID=A0A9W7SX24_9PEZI|nr:hypothetical protein Tdes44962_MAKER01839 [Teratosphaeria destructans]
MASGKFDEKVTVSTTAVPVLQDAIDDLTTQEAGVAKAKRDIKAAAWAIVCSVALPVIPMIIIAGALLGVIFRHQVDKYNTFYTNGGDPAYYVAFSPTTITTIAGMAGKVMPYLTTSIMGLVAFFAARMLIINSRRGDGEHLPSPEQLTILISLLNGSGWDPMWDTWAHRFTTKRGLAHPLPLAFTFMFFISILGFLLPAVDTWFGFATKETMATVLNITTGAWGLEWLPCNAAANDSVADSLLSYLTGNDQASLLATGLLKTDQILNYTTGNTTYFYIADGNISTGIDFKAKSIAVSAQCVLRTRECLPNMTWPWAGTRDTDPVYHCSDGFVVNASFSGVSQEQDSTEASGYDQSDWVPMIGLAFSPDWNLSRRIGAYDNGILSDKLFNLSHTQDGANLTDAQISANVVASGLVGTNWSYGYVQPQNPMYFGAWGTGSPTVDQSEEYDDDANFVPGLNNPLLADPQIYQGVSQDLAYWMLACEAYVYDVEYTWVNGSVRHFNATPSSADTGGLISGGFAFGYAEAGVLLNRVGTVAGLQSSSADLATYFANGWSSAALSLSIGVMSWTETIIEQRRETKRVTRVPIIPLYLYLALKALYVLTVIALAIGAYCFTHPAETEVVKQQLSPKGLADAHFNAPVVQEIQQRIQIGKDLKTGQPVTPPAADQEIDSVAGEVTSVNATPAALDSRVERRVGLVTRADGAWQFAVKANNAWHTIQPYVKEAQKYDSTASKFMS